MRKLNILLGIGITLSLPAFAQNEVDALRYSQLTFGGTARSSAMAGAFGALGGDFSTLSSNPAGLGLYRKNEISLTPSFFARKTTSTYNGGTGVDNKFNINFGNAGLIMTFPTNNDPELPGWRSFNFGFGYNRTNDFHNRIAIKGFNNQTSLSNVFLDNANGNYPSQLNQFSEGLAYNVFLIDTIPGDTSRYASQIPGGYDKTQMKTIQSTGSMGEIALSFGGNYNDKFYVGATLGIPRVRYYEESHYVESDFDTSLAIENFAFREYLSTKGRGVNFKLGIIYKPLDWFRFGAAVHTPTFLNLSDYYNSQMSAVYDNGFSPTSNSPEGNFDYELTTPMRALGSLGFVIGKHGIISADYEFVDYTSASLSAQGESFFTANEAIRLKYREAHNFKIGTEWRFDQFSLRGGYALYGNPFAPNVSNNGERTSYTAGFGFREDDYFVDFAYVLTHAKENYYLYNPKYVNAVQNRITTTSFMVSLGVKF